MNASTTTTAPAPKMALLRPTEAAERLRTTKKMVLHLVRTGRLRGLKLGSRTVLVVEESVATMERGEAAA